MNTSIHSSWHRKMREGHETLWGNNHAHSITSAAGVCRKCPFFILNGTHDHIQCQAAPRAMHSFKSKHKLTDNISRAHCLVRTKILGTLWKRADFSFWICAGGESEWKWLVPCGFSCGYCYPRFMVQVLSHSRGGFSLWFSVLGGSLQFSVVLSGSMWFSEGSQLFPVVLSFSLWLS